MKPHDLTGMRFGRLVAVRMDGRTKQGSVIWNCVCDCGNSKNISAASLRSGGTRSCGCLQKENPPPVLKTHGMNRTPEHNSWRGMIDRCLRPGSRYYSIYGGRGITVCDRWMKFENFIADMGMKPSKDHSIDRIDTDKGYFKENCRWATKAEQSFNRRCKFIPGVYPTASGKWQARIAKENVKVILGTFETLLDAAAARKSAELQLYGE